MCTWGKRGITVMSFEMRVVCSCPCFPVFLGNHYIRPGCSTVRWRAERSQQPSTKSTIAPTFYVRTGSVQHSRHEVGCGSSDAPVTTGKRVASYSTSRNYFRISTSNSFSWFITAGVHPIPFKPYRLPCRRVGYCGTVAARRRRKLTRCASSSRYAA